MCKIEHVRSSSNRTLSLVFSIFICLCVGSVSAQDLHYSQFYHAPLSVNPALTGIFNGDKRINVSVRDQWRSVPVPWFTTTLGYDFKIYPKSSERSFFGVGAFLNYDRQGDSRVTLGNLNLSGSYTYLLNRNNAITIGLAAGYALRGFNADDLTWDRQWDGEQFNASAASGEPVDVGRLGFFESAGGVNYRWQKSSRTKLDLGVGAFHLIEPNITFYNNDNLTLPRRFSAYGIGNVKLTETLDIQVDALYQLQDEYTELLAGAFLDFYLNRKPGKRFNLQVGGGYRFNEVPAVYPKIGIRYNEFFVALNYDIDISELNQHTNYRGGPEIHLTYIITNVKPLGQFKVCPIF